MVGSAAKITQVAYDKYLTSDTLSVKSSSSS
jgi:hypothetical protein